MKPDIRFDDENYEDPSSSDEDYTENEKRLLTKVRQKRRKESDSEEEVYGVRSAEEDSDDLGKQIADSDVGEDDDDIPDDRAWGKNKRLYYSTDYVDSDYRGFQAKEVDRAEREAEEASTLQQRDFQYLDDANVALEVSKSKGRRDRKALREHDAPGSSEEKTHIIEIESGVLVEDFKENMVTARDYLSPIIKKYKAGEIPESDAISFVISQHELILMYCTNIQMYLLLIASGEDVQHHPVRERLLQYKQLLKQLEPIFSEKIKPEIESFLRSERNIDKSKKRKKKLKILLNTFRQKEEEEEREVKSSKRIRPDASTVTKKLKLDIEEQNDLDELHSDEDLPENNENDENDYQEGSKRAITYQMAKNKGLTPYRKKELRNPRVKHRKKFRKALIRRKGAVREPRTEMTRYGGEMSGIKASVSKSIKIKV